MLLVSSGVRVAGGAAGLVFDPDGSAVVAVIAVDRLGHMAYDALMCHFVPGVES